MVCTGAWLETRKCPKCEDNADSDSAYNEYYYDDSSYSYRGPTPDDPMIEPKKEIGSSEVTWTSNEKDERPVTCKVRFGEYCPSEWPESVRDELCLPTPETSPAEADSSTEGPSDEYEPEYESGTSLAHLFLVLLVALFI